MPGSTRSSAPRAPTNASPNSKVTGIMVRIGAASSVPLFQHRKSGYFADRRPHFLSPRQVLSPAKDRRRMAVVLAQGDFQTVRPNNKPPEQDAGNDGMEKKDARDNPFEKLDFARRHDANSF